MKKLLCLTAATLLWSGVATAAEIAVTVNDVPISTFDIEARARLMSLQHPEELTNKRKSQLIKMAMAALVDDQIKIQEAKKQGLSVTDTDITKAIAHLETQNNMPRGQMTKMLQKNDIPLTVLTNQIQADLLWLQVVSAQQEDVSAVSPFEIDEKENKMRAKLREEAFFVAEVVVPTKESADEVVHAIKSGGHFEAIAKERSIADSKKTGGLVGWVKKGHYPPAVDKVLSDMQPGDLSAPIKTKDGYIIIAMEDKRNPITTDFVTIWDLAQMGIASDKTVKLMPQIVVLNSCDAFMKLAEENGLPDSVKRGNVAPDQLPRELRDVLKKQKMQTVVGPIRAQEGDVFFMKCGTSTERILPTRDEIKSQIEVEKMEGLSEQLLENAKRFAVIEYKD